MLGQPASSHTVCSPSLRTSCLSSVNSGPNLARVLIQAGLRSIGVRALRASMRSSLRPSGDTWARGSGNGGLRLAGVEVEMQVEVVGRCLAAGGVERRAQVALDRGKRLVHADGTAQLGRQ